MDVCGQSEHEMIGPSGLIRPLTPFVTPLYNDRVSASEER